MRRLKQVPLLATAAALPRRSGNDRASDGWRPQRRPLSIPTLNDAEGSLLRGAFGFVDRLLGFVAVPEARQRSRFYGLGVVQAKTHARQSTRLAIIPTHENQNPAPGNPDTGPIVVPRAYDHAARRFSAEALPVFRSATTSKETFCPSLRLPIPARSTALMCTKTSLPPSSGWMNPKPFWPLKNFTVPFVI